MKSKATAEKKLPGALPWEQNSEFLHRVTSSKRYPVVQAYPGVQAHPVVLLIYSTAV